MAGTFKFELVSPEKILVSVEAEQVVVPGADGDFTVLPLHAPFISTLRPGTIDILADGRKQRILVRGGLAEVLPDQLTILAQSATDVDEITPARFAEAIKEAEAELAAAETDDARSAADAFVSEMKRLAAKAA